MSNYFSACIRYMTVIAFAFAITQQAIAQTHTPITVSVPNGNCSGFYEYLPVNYHTNTNTKYPILIYVHGNGVYGNGTAASMAVLLNQGTPRVINRGEFPNTFNINGVPTSMIVISPQFHSKANPAQTNAFINFVVNRYRVDVNRVYLTGVSVGGDVAWKAPSNLANATRLAALVPVAGYNSPYSDANAQYIAAGKLPVWALHSNSDGVPVAWSQDFVNKINSYNPTIPAIITRFNNVTHDETHILVYNPTYRPNGKSLYEWMLGYSRNNMPIANAGNDQNIFLPDHDASLSSAGSSDPEGTPLSYLWSKISGPSQFSINNSSAANPVVSNLIAGIYQFQLRVTDGAGLTDFDTVRITVVNSQPNVLPVANAGVDVNIYLPQTSVSLSGGASYDPNGVVETYNWTKISGPDQFTITSPSAANTSVTNLKVGTYQFRLTVTDNEGGSHSDIVVVTVINPFPNVLPVARAGNDQSITLPVNTAALSGSASTDADGQLVAFKWTQVSGPNTALLSSPNTVNTNAGSLVVGTYRFELMVTDDSTGIDKDTVQVTVATVPPPSDNVVKVNVYGGSFPAGTGWNNWNVTSSLNLNSTTNENGTTSPVTANLTVSNAVADNGASYAVTMCPAVVGRTTSYTTVNRTLTISGLSNTKTYNLELYASRTGSGNSTRFVIGSNTVTVNTGNNYTNKAVFSGIAPTGGQIKVSLERLNTYNYLNGFVISEVVTGGGPNQAPVALAGNNQTITLPTAQVTLNGSSSYDADGSITGFTWQKLSGPAANITSTGSPTTTVTGLTEGVYVFQLTVIDDDDATATATVQVNVNNVYIPPTGLDSLNCGRVVKIVVLGSSTAVGSGSDPIDSSWVYKLRAYVRSKNAQSEVINLAMGGFTSYHTLNPSGFVPAAGRPAPDTEKNITKALTHNPDLIIVSLPSNDNGNNYTLQEQKDNYERMMAIADANNIPVFVSTTQPRNNMTTAQMNNQFEMRDWTYSRFGVKAVDFWSTIANADGTINEIYNADGIHLRNGGHHILYSRIVAERLLDTICLRKNQSPVANAGNAATIFLPTDSIQLSSAGSADSDGSIVSYAWSKVSGPAQHSFSNANIANPKARNLELGVYQFELRVTDNYGAIGKDTVVVNVNTVDPLPPVANAGTNISTTLPKDSVLLSGLASQDPDGTITAYHWTKISGPESYLFVDSLQSTARVRNLQEGNYNFELTVTDNSGMTDKDSVTVTVLPIPNQLPLASAGLDISIDYPGNSTSLDGGLSTDSDGVIVSYRWKKISGPAAYSIDDSTIVNPVITELTPGTYTIELLVTDDDGDIDRDSIRIFVGGPPNQLPVANAGADRIHILPGTVQLNGSGSFDPDGASVQFNWARLSGPVQFSIINASATNPVISNLVAGTYEIRLTVTDANGATDMDTVILTVYPPPNTAPVARAGNDQQITLPVNSVSLSGSASTDATGSIVSYGWLQITGPSAAQLSSPLLVNTNAGSLIAGTYSFQLTVTDDSSAVGRDTVVVIVNPAPTVTEKFVQVNIFGGSFPAGTGWNNWNVQSNLSLNSTTYSDGTPSPVKASLNVSNAIADNGAGYNVTMCPAVVGRTTSYSTMGRWVILTGLDNAKRYDLEVYSSRAATTTNTTRFIIGGTTILVNSINNLTNKAVFTNLAPSNGQIRMEVQRITTYNYINGFILTERSNVAGRGDVQDWVNDAPELPIVETTVVEAETPSNDIPLGVYPNPFSQNLDFLVNNKENGNLRVAVINQYGKTVRDMQFVKKAPVFQVQLPIQDLAPGIYFIKATMGNWRKTTKVVKL